MPNMNPEKLKMPEQAPDIRNKNFQEVALGYTPEMAIQEAQRCLNCKHQPCISGCPVNVHIPEFIAEVAKGDFLSAYQIITQTNALPAVCGRVCPQESQWELVVWSVLWRTGIWKTIVNKCLKNRLLMVKK